MTTVYQADAEDACQSCHFCNLVHLRFCVLLDPHALKPTATLEGELRFTHSRLLEAAEEIALYHGEETEKNIIERGYFALIKHVNRVLRIRVWHGMAEEGVVKWLWGALGLGICAIPVFGGEVLGVKGGNLGTRMEGGWRLNLNIRGELIPLKDL